MGVKVWKWALDENDEWGREKRGNCKRSAWLGGKKWGWGMDNRGYSDSDGTIDLVLLTDLGELKLAGILRRKSMKRAIKTPIR